MTSRSGAAARPRTECQLTWGLGSQRVADTYHVVVRSHSEAEAYLAELHGTVRELATSAHKALISEGCASYVKTIYVGYDIDGEMVAALYGHSDHVEIALALPEDAENRLLIDASHLTWRTLPVAAVVRTINDLVELQALLARSSERVRLSQHGVARDNDYFIRSKRHRLGGH